mmetsp:Transcript_14129/g.22475  ORF Transcript_14129/g.22475 Transcript_14129/m.22475 type:complete len:352 (+) Transcript_14129:98-1153(+)|eukprot:CAMPEP_0115077336 /NCGR_PEP_ID=MMETSP0227-20121206/16937_1 /TAXON_ID=89957 /ORGANISM="Polarella glacialis, Strain CCMP 1383" /LENGTH=351 /DNA_ID=CAMNT_0002464599 /DNA_START=88 /DNA_END=1143 /DNA_ORIENTATION=-
MGRKKTDAEPVKEVKKAEEPEEEEVEDSKIVKDLKEADDKYLAIEREYEKALQEVQRKYTEKQAPLLEQRMKLLTDTAAAESDADKKLGTPACKGFWLQAMKNLPALEDQIEEWDEEVLEYCCDVKKSYLDESDLQKGYKLAFHFVENPFFTNDVLWKEYYTEEGSPYTGEIDTTEIKASEISWKDGKDVTVEVVKKKVKGGGAKKSKQKGKESEEPRDSLFRGFFRNMKPDMEVPEDVNLEQFEQYADDEDDMEGMVEMMMENDFEIGCSIRDNLIPFAVRWYTGEAAPDDDFDEDEEEDEDDDDDEDEDDDDEDEEEDEAPKKGQKKKGGGGGGKAPADGEKQEECKQQ